MSAIYSQNAGLSLKLAHDRLKYLELNYSQIREFPTYRLNEVQNDFSWKQKL